MLKKLIWSVAILFVTSAVILLFVWRDYQTFTETALSLPEDGVLFEFKTGSSYQNLIADLASQNFIQNNWHWRLLGRLSKDAVALKAGEYYLHDLTPVSLLGLLKSGKTYQHSLTIVEGWSLKELLQTIAEHPVLIQTITDRDYHSLSAQLDLDYPHPEGLFLPETYRFPRGTTDIEFLQRAHADLKAVLDQQWLDRDPNLPYKSAYEVLIMASIIEKETALDHEREPIAGVFVRRLDKGMRLQTDPTVIYGLGDAYDGDIRFKDLRTDTPYNTYTRHGLPPTPIALPGSASIHAALHPNKGHSIYFVARGDGSHQFSYTLEEHNAAVNKYQRR